MNFNKNIPEIEKKIHYKFKDKSLLMQAFTRESFCNERRGEDYKSSEVLEFFGDSVLSTAIISILLDKKTERYAHGIKTDWNEGDFSNLKSKLSDKRNLSKSMGELGLQKFLVMGEGDAKGGIENEPSVMEDLFESIIGAIYIDCGMNIKVVIASVRDMLDVSVYSDADTLPPIQSFKNSLQEWCADKKHRLPPPVYKTLSESGPDHKKTYRRACYIGDKLYGIGEGKNQKLADAEAAKAALEALMAEENSKNAPTPDIQVKLRELCAQKKSPSPEWRDLGECDESTAEIPVFAIECKALGKTAEGKGRSKQEARSAAAKKILEEIEEEIKPKLQKHKPIPKKSYPKLKSNTPKLPKEEPRQKTQGVKEKQNPKEAHAPKKKPAWQKKYL